MPEPTALTAAVQQLADRVRALPQSTLRRGAAAEGLALARELARRAQLVEFPGREPLELPDAGVFSVADQLVVAGNDLAEALRVSGAAPDADGAEGACPTDDAVRLVRHTASVI